MASTRDIQDLCSEATCPICLDYFKDPVTITECGHNFCQHCLDQYWENEDDTLYVSCPQCRKTTQKKSFIPNWTLRNMVEIAQKLNLQDQGNDREVDGVCQKHQEPLKLFCRDHNIPICVVCDRSKAHKKDRMIPQEEAFQEYKDQICSRKKILRTERGKILKYKADAEIKSQDLLKQTEEKRQNTIADFQEIHQFLEDQEKRLLSQIEEVEKEIERRRDEYLARLCRELSSLENLIQEMEEKTQQPTSEFLQDIKRTLQRSEKEAFQNPVVFPPELTCRVRGLILRKPLLEDVMRQLEVNLTFCTKPKKKEAFENPVAFPSAHAYSMQPCLGGVKMQSKASVANVTLDPDTAHPRLILSEDRKSVRWGRRHQTLPPNPDRFDYWPFVLGQDGYSEGRHVWVVSVGREGDWAVGAARKSVRKKGWFQVNPEEGIWAVGKWGGKYKVLNVPKNTSLSLNQELKRIRIALNCDEGQVDFSDADTGLHLYTHTGVSFCGETLLPFFYVDCKVHLRLCP